jgi:AcrR family transcriptional regulator
MPTGAAALSDLDAPRAAGRPRDPRVDESVRAAALELLASEGYQGTSIQAIARRAGVSAPSIYRRWSSKAELIEAAVFPSDLLEPAALSSDVGTELADYCRRMLSYLAQPAVRAAVPGLLSEYQTDPQMWQRLVGRTVMPMRASFEAYLERTGRRPAVPVEVLFEVMLGALFARALNVGADGADEFSRELALIVTTNLAPAGRRRRLRR